jgi:hypothetical protein
LSEHPHFQDGTASPQQPATTTLGGIDPAALAIATAAIAVSTMIQDGPFTPLSSLIAFSILAVIKAYDRQVDRDWRQTLAFNSTIGLGVAVYVAYPLQALTTFDVGAELLAGIWLLSTGFCTACELVKTHYCRKPRGQ